MYTDEDLNDAVKKGVFSQAAVDDFKQLLANRHNTTTADEENFRLITGFNDVFVVIACVLLLLSSYWVVKTFHPALGLLVLPLLTWYLTEYFVRKRRMALPAIVLLLLFVGSLFALSLQVFQFLGDSAVVVATALAAAAAYLHWLRFRVPITIAAATAASIGFCISLLLTIFPELVEWTMVFVFTSGIIAFILAMYWDQSDRMRTSRHSDVAFWLHLLAAPLIVHPVFYSLGILSGNEEVSHLGIVIVLYIIMTVISIAIDRRAFMVSSLIYVLYALSDLLSNYGNVGDSFAVTGVIIGGALLLLSAFWQRTRALLMGAMPNALQRWVPAVKP